MIACGLLSKKIYCIGGKIDINGGLDNSVNVLDIAAYSGSTADELNDKWQTISSNISELNIKLPSLPQSMALPDGKSMILSGGMGFYNGSSPSTLAYNSENNSWSIYPEYTEFGYGRRQM